MKLSAILDIVRAWYSLLVSILLHKMLPISSKLQCKTAFKDRPTCFQHAKDWHEYLAVLEGCKKDKAVTHARMFLNNQTQPSNLLWMPNRVINGFFSFMITESSRQFQQYPTNYMWISSQVSIIIYFGARLFQISMLILKVLS